MTESRDVYMNLIQQRIFYAGARNVDLSAARRFGKTDGVIGPRLWTVSESMPRGAGAFLGSSRKQLFSRTIPAAMAAQERFYGYKEGVHYGWGRPPKWVEPCIIRPKSYDNCMWYANGFIYHTISTSVYGSANGLTLNTIIADECKFLPKKKIDEEIMPALSGIVHPMGHPGFSDQNPYYKSTLFCSDAALTSKGNWLEKEEAKLDLKIEGGELDGKTYREVMDELDRYANRVIYFNELIRNAKRAGIQPVEVSIETKQRMDALVQAIRLREGPYRIVPPNYKDMKAIASYLYNYKVIDERTAELLTAYQFLLTHEEIFELAAIRGSKKFQQHINDLRCNSFYFVRASSIDNIDILGEEYIKRMARDLPPIVFCTSILNLKPGKIGEGFYYKYDPDIHCYVEDYCPAVENAYTTKQATCITGGTAYHSDYETIDFRSLSNREDCTLDGDVHDDAPLEIAMDAGKIVSWIVTGQMYRRDHKECLNVLSSMFVKDGLMIQDLLRKWNAYYAPHRRKKREVNFYYDHTFKFKPTGVYVDDIKDTVIKELTNYGWIVNAISIGQTWPHAQRYKDINEGLSEYSYPSVRFNAENNEALCIAIENCGTKISYSGEKSSIKKDKTGEKLAVDSQRVTEGATPEELRSDGTDAFDTLYIGVRHYRNSFGVFWAPSGH